MEENTEYNDSNMYNVSKRSLEKLISDHDYRIYELINYSIITTTVCLCGIVTNLMNIVVFYRQGFEYTMNISLMGLAVSDLCSLVTLLLCDMFLGPFLTNVGARVVSTEVQYLIAGLPHMCFVRITSWITVFIAAERCLCILFPLKIKELITKRRTTMAICFIYACILLSLEPEYETSYLAWKFDVTLNTTLIGLHFRSHRRSVEGLAFIVFGILGFVSFLAVIIFTLILVVQLNKKSRWRKNAHLEKLQSESISNRDRKTVSMVVMIATVLIVCYTPGVIQALAIFCVPEFSITGRYGNAYLMGWSFVVIFESVNSSVNIFLYYYMSSKFRETFRRIFAYWDQ